MMKTHIAFERYLNIRCAYTPAWLSDDQRIAFLSDISGTPQIWAVDSTGGWPDQLTFFQDKVWTLNVSPSGDRFIKGNILFKQNQNSVRISGKPDSNEEKSLSKN